MKKCTRNSLITILTAGLIGAGIALLFVPYKGKKVRKKIKSALKFK